jgi:hypothetical protein
MEMMRLKRLKKITGAYRVKNYVLYTVKKNQEHPKYKEEEVSNRFVTFLHKLPSKINY